MATQFAQLPQACPYQSRKPVKSSRSGRPYQNDYWTRLRIPCGQCSYCRAIKIARAIGVSLAERMCHETAILPTLTFRPDELIKRTDRFRSNPNFKLTVKERMRFLMLRDGLDPFDWPNTDLHGFQPGVWDEHNARQRSYRKAAREADPDATVWNLSEIEISWLSSFWKHERDLMLKRFSYQLAIRPPRHESTYEIGPSAEGDHRGHCHGTLYGVPEFLVPLRKEVHQQGTEWWPYGRVTIDDLKPKGVRYLKGYTQKMDKLPYHIGHGGSTRLGDAEITRYFHYLLDLRDGKRSRDLTRKIKWDAETGYLEKPVYAVDHKRFPLSKRHLLQARSLGILPRPSVTDLEVEQAEEEAAGDYLPEELTAEMQTYYRRRRELSYKTEKAPVKIGAQEFYL